MYFQNFIPDLNKQQTLLVKIIFPFLQDTILGICKLWYRTTVQIVNPCVTYQLKFYFPDHFPSIKFSGPFWPQRIKYNCAWIHYKYNNILWGKNCNIISLLMTCKHTLLYRPFSILSTISAHSDALSSSQKAHLYSIAYRGSYTRHNWSFIDIYQWNHMFGDDLLNS